MVKCHGDDLAGCTMPLPNRLSAILVAGLTERNGCVFLAGLLEGCTSASQQDFPDKTGYECFVNHIHIDDFAASDKVRVAVAFLTRVAAMLKAQYRDDGFRGLIGMDGTDVTVRFHRARANEEWLSNDLEGYEDCVCEFEL